MPAEKRNDNLSKKQADDFRGQVLAWYDLHKRNLPWRDVNDPYKTWLSEIMLQQTTVQAVKAYYEKFLIKWPTIQHLAKATQDEVMHEWAGLGYYSRARNLHKCAQIIVAKHNGHFPQDQITLKKLPGIGDYSSAAIMTIAFNTPATVVDGNIERIITRHRAITDPLPKSKPIIKAATAPLFENASRAGYFAQALMDIGATICTPKNPKCTLCPVNESCLAKAQGTQENFPYKTIKKKRPFKTGTVYWIENTKGEILLERRPETGLLAGTLGFPTSDWITSSKSSGSANSITHTFTHFDLELTIEKASAPSIPPVNCSWHAPTSDSFKGLPSLFMKVYKQVTASV